MYVKSGAEVMRVSPLESLVEWILRSRVFSDIEDVSSTTSRLRLVNCGPIVPQKSRYVLDDNLARILKRLQVRLEGKVVVQWLHIGRKHLTTFRQIDRAGGLSRVTAEVFTHLVALVAAIASLIVEFRSFVVCTASYLSEKAGLWELVG